MAKRCNQKKDDDRVDVTNPKPERKTNFRGKKRSPLEIMILVMNKALNEGDHDSALTIAYKAAPYCHPKLTEVKSELPQVRMAEEMTEDELKMFIEKNT